MGCDIHMYVEQYRDGAWHFLPAPEIELFKNQDGSSYTGDYWYWGRNYTLFGYLADVRNDLGYGTSRVQPIDTPRGIPEDASAEYKKITGPYERCNACEEPPYNCNEEHGWGADGHSHSYFTLRELIHAQQNADERVVEHRGWVSPTQYAEYQKTGAPSGWCGGVGGGNVKHVSNSEMEMLLKLYPELAETRQISGATSGHSSYYTELRWCDTLKDQLGTDWQQFLDQLGKLTFDDGSDVRAVFFFDN